ncbi:hypothetical protein K8R42_04580 [bacterium]|nr:hypothetical protein [bacterium]
MRKLIWGVVIFFLAIILILSIIAIVNLGKNRNSLEGNEDVVKIIEDLPCYSTNEQNVCLNQKSRADYITKATKYQQDPDFHYQVKVFNPNTGWDARTGGFGGVEYYDVDGNETTHEECLSKVDEFTVVRQYFNTDFYFVGEDYKSAGIMNVYRSVLFDSNRKVVCQELDSGNALEINVH